MSRTLLVDVGGTHTRCALADDDLHGVSVFNNAEHADLISVLRRYYAELSLSPPTVALVAVAAPVTSDGAYLTNLKWEVNKAELTAELGFEHLRLVNDFAALACAVPHLPRRDLLVLQEGRPHDNKHNIAVMGPGTGMGVSGLLPCLDEWIPVSGEGGHMTLAAVDEREEAVIARLRGRFGHVSAERVLSGPGLLNLYALLSEDDTVRAPEDITRLATRGDGAAAEAMDLFFGFLATVGANLALTLGSRGGLYLGGGILPQLERQLLDSQFITRFRNRGRFSGYLKSIPVYLITAENPALLGLQHYPKERHFAGLDSSR